MCCPSWYPLDNLISNKTMERNVSKTVVLGASVNPERYSHLAIQLLRNAGREVLAVGPKPGRVADVDIQELLPQAEGVDTVTLYLNPSNQRSYYEDILRLEPRRIIFNPGTENPELEALATARGIEVQHACTLVLVRTGQY